MELFLPDVSSLSHGGIKGESTRLELAQRFLPLCSAPSAAGRAGAGAAESEREAGNGPAAAGSHGLHREQLLERREIPFCPLGSQRGRGKGAGSSTAGMGLH